MRLVVLLVFFSLAAGLVFFAIERNVQPQHYIPHPVVFKSDPVRDLALKTRQQITKGDFASADKALEAMFAQTNQKKDYYPFSYFLVMLVPPGEADFKPYLDAWVKAEPKSAMAYMARAEYEFDRGAFIRGDGYIENLSQEHVKLFTELFSLAYNDIVQYLNIRDDNPYAYKLLMLITKSIGSSELKKYIFTRAVTRFPDVYDYYYVRLNELEPKWGGSLMQMFSFVESATAKLDRQSTLNLLWVALYDDVVGNADVICKGIDEKSETACEIEFHMLLHNAALEDKIKQAIMPRGKDYEFALNNYIMSGHARHVVEIAQQQLPEDNYALNFALGAAAFPIEGVLSDCLPVVQLFKGAVQDPKTAYDYLSKSFSEANGFSFPSQKLKNQTLMRIVEGLAHASYRLGDKRAALQYINYGIELDDRNMGLYGDRCYVNMYSHNLYRAIDDCTAALSLDDTNVQVRFLLAKALKYAGDNESARKEFWKVIERAQSNDYFIAQQSYGSLGEFKKALAVFDEHPEMFNEDNPASVATAYNDRCFTYQQLGQYQKALDDCNKSLSIQYMPVAAIKKQQLLQKLGKQ